MAFLYLDESYINAGKGTSGGCDACQGPQGYLSHGRTHESDVSTE